MCTGTSRTLGACAPPALFWASRREVRASFSVCMASAIASHGSNNSRPDWQRDAAHPSQLHPRRRSLPRVRTLLAHAPLLHPLHFDSLTPNFFLYDFDPRPYESRRLPFRPPRPPPPRTHAPKHIQNTTTPPRIRDVAPSPCPAPTPPPPTLKSQIPRRIMLALTSPAHASAVPSLLSALRGVSIGRRWRWSSVAPRSRW